MNSAEAKQIPITQLLDYWGEVPTSIQRSGKEIWYRSPLRNVEKTASFKVDTHKNVWFDFGLGKGGSILDLIVERERTDIKGALNYLKPFQKFIGKPLDVRQTSFLNHPIETSSATNAEGDRIVSVKQLSNTALLNYLSSRKIDLDIARAYLKEVYFTNRDKTYFAAGFENATGGFEIRNPYYKSCIGSKDITFFQGIEETVLLVFEGWTDFLAYLTTEKKKYAPESVFVMNTLSTIKRLEKAISEGKFLEVRLFLDNDEAGKKATADLKEMFPAVVKAMNHVYEGHKDFNAMLIAKK